MIQPRELIEGDAVGLRDDHDQYWVPARYVGMHAIDKTLMVFRVPPTVGRTRCDIAARTTYGAKAGQWLFAEDCAFMQPCPSCIEQSKQEYDDASRNILAEGFKYEKKVRGDCQECGGRGFVSYEPFAGEAHI